MQKLLENPNIPKGKVTTALAGNMPKALFNAFISNGIRIITMNNSDHLQPPVASHADMLGHHLGKGGILLSYCDNSLLNELKNLGMNPQIIKKQLKSEYPNDISLNCARLGNRIIGKKDSISEEILEYCNKNNIEIINVPQGYAKCSICIVNENAIITEDKKIKEACEEKGIDALLIDKGYVSLAGYDYGFIGGCSGLISKNELAFFGNIKSHKDYKKIISFLSKYNKKAVSLTKDELVDIGGIIPILEEVEGK